jgi:hypothetical protein
MKNLIKRTHFALYILLTCVIISCDNSQKSIAEKREYLTIQEKAISKELYKQQVMLYCIEKQIYIDVDKIDSMYMVVDPKVQQLLNAR